MLDSLRVEERGARVPPAPHAGGTGGTAFAPLVMPLPARPRRGGRGRRGARRRHCPWRGCCSGAAQVSAHHKDESASALACTAQRTSTAQLGCQLSDRGAGVAGARDDGHPFAHRAENEVREDRRIATGEPSPVDSCLESGLQDGEGVWRLDLAHLLPNEHGGGVEQRDPLHFGPCPSTVAEEGRAATLGECGRADIAPERVITGRSPAQRLRRR